MKDITLVECLLTGCTIKNAERNRVIIIVPPSNQQDFVLYHTINEDLWTTIAQRRRSVDSITIEIYSL